MAVKTLAQSQIETVRYARVRVAVTAGPDIGQLLEGAGTTLTVGTGPSASLRLNDPKVSREHCEITLSERGFRVRDLQSTNGIRIGGLRVYDVAASAPIVLALGDSELTIAPLGEAEPRERASVGRFGDLLGEAPKMRELFALLSRVAPTDLSVLIQGETGTGKELVAQSLHRASQRAENAFVIFDCSAVAANLLESELFGHERGAFTGAHAARTGALEEADGGTLFLDEIGELPMELQQKLLRCLQSGEFKPVGGRKLQKTALRVIAATHRSLLAEVEAGRFREDLYYRLEGVTVHVPPLRERLEDIPLLVDHFLSHNSPGAERATLSEETLAMFRAHRWPGNVRELANAVRRMHVLPELPFRVQAPLTAADVQSGAELAELERVSHKLSSSRALELAGDGLPRWLQLDEARRLVQNAFERDYLSLLKHLSRFNKTRAAAWAGVSRQAIQKLVRKHDFDWAEDASDL